MDNGAVTEEYSSVTETHTNVVPSPHLRATVDAMSCITVEHLAGGQVIVLSFLSLSRC
jgi:hypothetical protein